MHAVMAFWNHLAAMLRRPCDSLSKVAEAGPQGAKNLSFQVDNKSAR